MTIELSVGDVRTALNRAGGEPGVGDPASLLLGTLFHRTFGDLVSRDPERSGLRVIAEGRGDDARRRDQLLTLAWSRLVAPRLLRHAAALQATSAQVLTAWHATKNLCTWLDRVVMELLEKHPETQGSWESLAALLQAEVPLSCDLQEPQWTERVRLIGIADSILRVPHRSGYCAIELKLGRAKPVVDLGQAVLYHLILKRSAGSPGPSALSLLRFSPELDERLVEAKAVAEAERRLLELIGSLAGVIRETPESAGAPPPAAPRPPAGSSNATNVAPKGSTIANPGAPAPTPAPPDLEETAKRLQRAYREHGVGLEVSGTPQVGPRFIRFGLRLLPGSRSEKVRQRTGDVQLRLELAREPMVVQDAGRLYIDIERRDPQTVLFSSIRAQLPQLDELRGSAEVPLGVDPGGRLQFADLASSGRSHILVAGTTGSGKSEWLRTALGGLIASNTPETLRVVTLDPKLAAFADLEHSKFLWKKGAWWIPGMDQSPSDLFQDLVEEMERRYRMTRETGADNLREHVEKTGKSLARIVCVCDEYYALVSQQKEEKQAIEAAIGLLGAKGRAAGIHLILATQQPSRQTINGAIQANLPCRVALYLQSPIESNMIINQSGAERLTGMGDLLYKDFGNPVRLQGAYLPGAERAGLFR
jgi:DNA segregation ATPase FtsK/SpoIIIE, S-DNA-T family